MRSPSWLKPPSTDNPPISHVFRLSLVAAADLRKNTLVTIFKAEQALRKHTLLPRPDLELLWHLSAAQAEPSLSGLLQVPAGAPCRATRREASSTAESSFLGPGAGMATARVAKRVTKTVEARILIIEGVFGLFFLPEKNKESGISCDY